MMKLDLCGQCAALIADAYELRRVSGGKVTCAHCGRRRYGGTYEAVPKRRKLFEKG